LERNFLLKCLDTDLLVAILRGKQEAAKAAHELDQEGRAATTSINAFELYYGANKSQQKEQNLKETKKLLVKLEIFPLDHDAVQKAAEIAVQLAEKGQPIDYRDAMIAAVAMQNDAVLLTRNAFHFQRIKGLKTKGW
jgi:tRNA(fMet)-specific endonuclease VapC